MSDCKRFRDGGDSYDGCPTVEIIEAWRADHIRLHETEMSNYRSDCESIFRSMDQLRSDMNLRISNINDRSIQSEVKIGNLENRIVDMVSALGRTNEAMNNMTERLGSQKIEIANVSVKQAVINSIGTLVVVGIAFPFLVILLEKLIKR